MIPISNIDVFTWSCFSLNLSFSCCNLDFSSLCLAMMSTTLSLSPAGVRRKYVILDSLILWVSTFYTYIWSRQLIKLWEQNNRLDYSGFCLRQPHKIMFTSRKSEVVKSRKVIFTGTKKGRNMKDNAEKVLVGFQYENQFTRKVNIKWNNSET